MNSHKSALLISAAPDLLEALKLSDRVLSEARGIVAEFEDHGNHECLGGKGYRALDHMDEARAKNRAAIVKAEETTP